MLSKEFIQPRTVLSNEIIQHRIMLYKDRTVLHSLYSIELCCTIRSYIICSSHQNFSLTQTYHHHQRKGSKFGQHSWPLSSEGSLAYATSNIYMVISEGPMTQAVELLKLRLLRLGIKPKSPTYEASVLPSDPWKPQICVKQSGYITTQNFVIQRVLTA